MQARECPQCGTKFTAKRTYCSKGCRKAAANWTTQTCPQCQQPFSFFPSVYKNGRVCCSFECRKAASHVMAICPVCAKEFRLYRNEAHRRNYCSFACAGKGRAEQRKGIPQPHARGPRPERLRQVALVCEMCSKPFSVQLNESKGRRFCSKACHARWQVDASAGDKNFHWRGGYENYYGPNRRPQRRNARRRDNYTCQRCGITEDQLSRQLDVHHIKPFGHYGIDYFQEANKLSNLISLCASCHLTVEHEQETR